MVEVSAIEVRVTVRTTARAGSARPPHVGLWSMHERAAEVGGGAAVTSAREVARWSSARLAAEPGWDRP